MEVPPVLSVLLKEGELTRIEVKPDSVIVIQMKDKLRYEDLKNIREYISKVWPNNKVLVLDDSASLSVVAPEDEGPHEK